MSDTHSDSDGSIENQPDHPFTSLDEIREYDWSDFELQARIKQTIHSHRDPQILAYCYWVIGESQADIGRRLRVTQPTISNQMDRLGIPRIKHPSNSDAVVGYHQQGGGSARYAKVTSTVDGERDGVYVHQLLACLDNDPYEVFCGDSEVHHETGHPLDNRPEVVDLVSPKEHHSLHDADSSGWIVEDGEPRLRCNPSDDATDPASEWWGHDPVDIVDASHLDNAARADD